MAIPFNPLLETPTSQALNKVTNQIPQLVCKGLIIDSIMLQRNEKKSREDGGKSMEPYMGK